MIKCEFAPMEGITGYTFRRAHAARFCGAHCYYTPFIAANSTRSFKTREKKEADPANNAGIRVIPQILTKDPGDLIWAAGEMRDRGYDEVNLNLGCPSPTVVSRGKGSAMLGDPGKLDIFMSEVFERGLPDGISLSVKTRGGFEDFSRAEEIARVLDRYPLSRVIVHPRYGRQMYRGKADPEVFGIFCGIVKHPLVYNGDIRSAGDAAEIMEAFPGTEGVMIGRGALSDPALMREIDGGPRLELAELKSFHDDLMEGLIEDLGGFGNSVGKLKELWHYFSMSLTGCERELKHIRKSRSREEYVAAVRGLFAAASFNAP